jgi:hypothetical protein
MVFVDMAHTEMKHPATDPEPKRVPFSGWNRVAVFAWVVTAAAIFLRVAQSPHRQSCIAQYLLGGEHWRHSQPLYHDKWGGFIYSPIVAAFFSLFTYLPAGWDNLLWQVILFAALTGGIAVVLRRGPFRGVPPDRRAFVFLAILPLAIGNLDRSQANPLVAGLLLLAITAAGSSKWAQAAIAVGIATYFKVYPLSIGLLLCLVWPKKIPWRLALVLMALGALPFALHAPHYVLTEYRSWIETRSLDNRFLYAMNIAPLDLWYLLVRIGHLPLSGHAYLAIQVLGAAAIAVFCLAARHHGWNKERILAGLFVFASVWMTLLGPATEAETYLLLAPAAGIGVVQAFSVKISPWARSLAMTAFGLLIVGIIRGHLFTHTTNVWFRAVQPLGAIVFCGYAVSWLKNEALWRFE